MKAPGSRRTAKAKPAPHKIGDALVDRPWKLPGGRRGFVERGEDGGFGDDEAAPEFDDSPCLENGRDNCDDAGTGEGRYHGRM